MDGKLRKKYFFTCSQLKKHKNLISNNYVVKEKNIILINIKKIIKQYEAFYHYQCFMEDWVI